MFEPILYLHPLFTPSSCGPLHLFNLGFLYLTNPSTPLALFIAVQYDPNAPLTQTHLTFAIPQSGRQSALRENYETLEPPVFQEWTATEIVPSQVWAIVELSDANPKNSPASLRRSDGLALSALPRQAEAGPRGFLVLAASGLFWVDQPRPVDILKANLEIEKDVAVNTIRMT